jgi:hypothetical protein
MRGKSYVGETGKSMKVTELTVAQKIVGVKSPYPSQRVLSAIAVNASHPYGACSESLGKKTK